MELQMEIILAQLSIYWCGQHEISGKRNDSHWNVNQYITCSHSNADADDNLFIISMPSHPAIERATFHMHLHIGIHSNVYNQNEMTCALTSDLDSAVLTSMRCHAMYNEMQLNCICKTWIWVVAAQSTEWTMRRFQWIALASRSLSHQPSSCKCALVQPGKKNQFFNKNKVKTFCCCLFHHTKYLLKWYNTILNTCNAESSDSDVCLFPILLLLFRCYIRRSHRAIK